jgi:hypothetical protein
MSEPKRQPPHGEPVKITVKTERTLFLPLRPNFIRTLNDEAVDIGDLTEEQLREIGRAWTEAMVRKGRDRRGEAVARLNRQLRAERGEIVSA